jgi:hypothetical protein
LGQHSAEITFKEQIATTPKELLDELSALIISYPDQEVVQEEATTGEKKNCRMLVGRFPNPSEHG